MTKKITALVLCFLLCLSSVTGIAFAAKKDVILSGTPEAGNTSVECVNTNTGVQDGTYYGTIWIDGNFIGIEDVTVENGAATVTIKDNKVATAETVEIHFSAEERTSSGDATVTSVTLSPTSLTLEIGATHELVATVTMSDESDYSDTITWTSSDPAVAEVDADGKVTAVAVGTAEITATAGDVTSDPCEVTVTTSTENTYTVTFDLNGATGTAPEAQSVEENGIATKPTDPTREGYIFGGWYTDADCTTAYDFTAAVTSDITLYAKWTAEGGEVVVYTITFDPNGGTCSTETMTTSEDGTLSSLPTATRNNYAFDGWYTATTGGTKITTSSVFAENTTVYAHWTYHSGSSGGSSSSSSGGSSGGSNSYAVSVGTAEHGTVTASPTSAASGKTVTLTVAPDEGYELGSLAVKDKNGSDVAVTKVSDTQYTFTMPSGKVTITPTFVEAGTKNPFVDVADDQYYYDAVIWAVENGITTGTTATTFSPDASCTRAQMVTFLWRLAGSPESTTSNPFTDVQSGEYYYDAVLWAVETGVTNGTSATTFSPNAIVTRAQTVTFLYRYENGTVGDDTTIPFTDVPADAYYADAVAWAVENGITNGTSETTFSPNDDCTRAQIVTFLYRDKLL